MAGFTDKPMEKIASDIFGLDNYIHGLSAFILECDTPMTIAIQGDWGSGKTSMMNMIKEHLGEKIVPIWFNTWQFSQFNMGDQLALFLMNSMVEAFGINDEKSDNIRKKLGMLAKLSKNAAVVLTDTLVGGKAAEFVESGLNKSSDIMSEKVNIVKEINFIKNQFQDCVNSSLKENQKDRVVIFVDDLDRLQPSKAVELLEVLKIFLDCDSCVFVLAIDYQVVSQGVKQKYGSLIGEEKGKSFFDKIIQVPFKMPVAQYDVFKYVSSMLKSIGIDSGDDEVTTYIAIIQSSIGCNPRSMKHLFNAYLLLSKVATPQMLDTMWKKKVLFGVLCLQLSFESVYNYISNNRMGITDTFLSALSNKDKFLEYADVDLLRKDFGFETDDEEDRMIRFMKNFTKVIDRDGNLIFSDDELLDFASVIGFSTITSATKEKNVEDDDERWRFRRATRQIVKNLNDMLKAKYGLEFGVYQSNSDRGNWKFYYATSWKWLYKSHYPFSLNINIKSDLISQRFGYEFVLKPEKQTTANDMFELLGPFDLMNVFPFDKQNGSYIWTLPLENDDDEIFIRKVFDDTSTILEVLKDCFYE